ncbi:MurR/RpiR family transcriptional regulator [Rhizohabitans arisaemae]|uniref:MurR/RpiR family transcriptional regulator n=1 Tax=Rhizohabitans arisaemae TaxID=2720610 RepID=UPI0024B0D51E|nr:MurR/RpiR family transcriptional regulator [Rhizohabitans arisaemae]
MTEHATTAGSGTVRVRIHSMQAELTGALSRVAEIVLTDPQTVARATIVELAERSGTSPATVTRFCRALGFAGYSDLRLSIAAETGLSARPSGWTADIGREIQPNDPLARVLEHLVAADQVAVRETAERLDLNQIERTAEAIARAGRVEIYGVGGSGLVGAELQRCLHRIGVPSWWWSDTHSALAGAALLRPGDVAIGISNSGQTSETIEALAEAACHDATTVALTSHPRSPLAELADIVLYTSAHASTFRAEALSARHPQLIVLDLVYIAVAQRTYERAHAAFQITARAVTGHRAQDHPSTLRRRRGGTS